ncbi:MAG: D-aminoacyl-tRNA deacylase [Alphaproteobacteria bacterium]
MKIVLQRVSKASVVVDNKMIADVAKGFLILFCAEIDDKEEDAKYLASKIIKMRIFSDEQDKMNLSIKDVGGQILAVSQFTLSADWRRGNRPSFSKAEKPERGNDLYNKFCSYLEEEGIEVQKGIFGAKMEVELLNDGPVTIIMDSKN